MALSNRNVPTPQAQERQDARARLAPELATDIVAKPLADLAADTYKLKDKAFELRLVNYSVGEKESKMRFHQMRAAGYVPVKVEELEAGSSFYETMDGHIMVGDCVLMKIPKPMVHGAKKYNWEKAMKRTGFRGASSAAEQVAKSDIAQSGAASSQLKKVSVFVPGQDVVNGLVGSDADKK